MYAVKLGTQLSIDIIEREPNEPLYTFCYRNIECDTIEVVNPKGLEKPFVLVINEEGLLAADPAINFVGSYLYGTQDHHNPIVGEVLIMQEITTNSGIDLAFLTNDQAWMIAGKMKNVAIPAFRAVRSSMMKAGLLY